MRGTTNADTPQLYAGHHTIATCITFHAPNFLISRIYVSLNLHVLVPSVLDQHPRLTTYTHFSFSQEDKSNFINKIFYYETDRSIVYSTANPSKPKRSKANGCSSERRGSLLEAPPIAASLPSEDLGMPDK